ncbi:MAG: type II secretion system F family protein [Candidatus Cloacimonadales bacterium]
MANFAYTIKDAKGARREGIIKANTMDEAIDKLATEGGTIISVKNAQEGSFKGKLSLFDKIMLAIYKIRTSVKLKTLVFFTRQLSTMFSAGLTIEKAITNLGKEEKDPKFKKVLKRVDEDIRKGYSLSESFEQHPGVFNPLYISLVKAGEVSGTLHTVLDELAENLERTEDTRRKVNSAMTYPVFILFFLMFVVWFLFYYIVPKFSDIYGSFGAELPAATRIAISISNVIKGNLFATIGIILAVGIFFFIINLTDKGRWTIDLIKLKIPVVGGLVESSVMSKFSRTFSILMKAGVPIMDTLELVENVVGNAVIEGAVRKARVMIKEGYGIAHAFRSTRVFPSTLLQMISTGEETGDLDKLLSKTAEFYDKIIDSVIDKLTSLIEPMLIILMSGVVGSIIIVIYLPIFNLGEAMSEGLK